MTFHPLTASQQGGATKWVDVIAYGADPTGANASDAAFAAAVATFNQTESGTDVPASVGGTLYIPAGTYKITQTLNWKINGLVVVTDGASAVIIEQNTANIPIVQVAGYGQNIGGITFTYTVLQAAANTSAIAMELGDDTVGSCFESYYHELNIKLAQTGMAVNPAIATAAGVFSCTFSDIQISGFTTAAINLNANNSLGANTGTGCVFSNIYAVNSLVGLPNQNAAGPVVTLKNFNELVINQLNIEHCNLTAGDALLITVMDNLTINGLHFEALTTSVNHQALIHLNGHGTVNLNSVTAIGNTYTGSADNAVIRFFGTGPTMITMNGFYEHNNTVTTPSHPLVDFAAATNCTAWVSGISNTQTTVNAINTGQGGCNLILTGGASGGITPISAFTAWGYGNSINTTAGGSSVMVAGTFYYAAIFVPYTSTLTGIQAITGGTGGTDNWIVALWASGGGTALATSALAGIVAPSANVKKAFPFTAPVTVYGPAVYILGVQSNGITARLLTFQNAAEGFITGSVAGVFGTVPSLTPAGTYSASTGPMANTY